MRLLTAHVIDTVTAQAAAWRTDGITPRLAVNISARDLYSETIVAQLGERLTYHQLPAHQFQVEITESALTTDPVRARATLMQLAELGIDISLDDFGTGFSSLQQVRGTPLTEIKVDQSFVKGMTSNRDDAAIVAATINLAHSLGLRAVAEGVEDEPTLARLTELGCELGQGWLISHPVPADRVPALIANGSVR
jgi:EAL domain-containing protein (putative c-di-GMP-specific phosphodiesterase class I)